MKKYLLSFGCLLLLFGCNDQTKVNSGSDKTIKDKKEAPTQAVANNTNDTSNSSDNKSPEDLRDLSYIELTSQMKKVVGLAAMIKKQEIKLDSTYAKDSIIELSNQIPPKIEESRSAIIPNLEQNKANEYYSMYIDELEAMLVILENAINNVDYTFAVEFNQHVLETQKIIKAFGDELGI